MIRTPAIKHALSLLFVLVFLGTGVGGFFFLASFRDDPAPREPQENRLSVEVFRIGSENIRQTLSGFGTVQADREVVLSAEVAGAIDHVHPDFEVGLAVVAPRYPASDVPQDDRDEPLVDGDELVVIDKDRYRGQLRQIDSQIAELQAEMRNSKDVQKLVTRQHELMEIDFQQKKALHDKGVLSLAELNRLELEVKQYHKNKTQADRDVELTTLKVETLQAQKELLEDDLKRTVIHSPFDGYISEVFVEQGQYVKPGDRLVRITNIERVEIPVSLTLDDYENLKPQLERGVKPQARLSLHEDEAPVWNGEVFRIAPEANRETRTITVFVEVDNSRQDVPLLPGTFVFARIEGPIYESDEFRIIPRDAILGERVFRIDNGVARDVRVKIREKLQSVAVVEGDLKPGDLLVLTNLDLLTEGLRIEPGNRVHELVDEHDPDPEQQWKYYWQILPPERSTAERETEPASQDATPETSEVTN